MHSWCRGNCFGTARDVQHQVWTSIQERRQSGQRLTGGKEQHNVLEEKTVFGA